MRWSYALNDHRCQCDITLDRDDRLYEFRVRLSTLRRVIVECYGSIQEAIERQSEFERLLIQDGYSLQSFETLITEPATDPLRIAIINANPDTGEMLIEYFHRQGWEAEALVPRLLGERAVTGAELMAEHRPDAILFDVALPYEENWEVARRLEDDPQVTCPVIITTTNEAALRRLLSPTRPLLEIVGTPYNLDVLKQAVLEALHRKPAVPDGSSRERRRRDRRHGDRRASSLLNPNDRSDDRARVTN